MITEKHKKFIDNSTYEILLNLWRNAPIGSVMFQGETGDYYAEVMKAKRNTLKNSERVSASKNVGW